MFHALAPLWFFFLYVAVHRLTAIRATFIPVHSWQMKLKLTFISECTKKITMIDLIIFAVLVLYCQRGVLKEYYSFFFLLCSWWHAQHNLLVLGFQPYTRVVKYIFLVPVSVLMCLCASLRREKGKEQQILLWLEGSREGKESEPNPMPVYSKISSIKVNGAYSQEDPTGSKTCACYWKWVAFSFLEGNEC